MKSPMLLATVFLLTSPVFMLSQNFPSNASQASNNKPVAWLAGTTVSFYIDTSSIAFGSQLYNSIVNSVRAQNNILGNNVTYTDPINVQGCPVATGPTELVSALSLPSQYTGTNNQMWDNTPNSGPIQPLLTSEVILDTSKMNTNVGLLSPDYATKIAGHEVFHNTGAGDVADGDPSVTIMAPSTPESPGLTAPSSDDSSGVLFTQAEEMAVQARTLALIVLRAIVRWR